MAVKIVLMPDEQKLYDTLFNLVKKVQEYYRSNTGYKDVNEIPYKEIADKAHELHMMLKERGLEPKHHKYMYENRRVPVEDKEFYNHLHPVEDLLAFINDPDANNDPKDTTIGVAFSMKIYTRRWGHYDLYTLVRINTGWRFRFSNTIDCDKECRPGLFDTLDNDIVSYPYNVGELFEWIWKKASEGATTEEVQKAIDDIAEWISICEKSVPRGMFEELL